MTNLILGFGISYFLFFSTIAIVAPYLQVILESKGLSPVGIGILLGFYEVTGIAGPLLGGLFAEKMERYRLPMLFFSSLAGGFFLLFGFSRNFLWTAVLLILFGLFYRPYPSLQDALASRTLINPIKSYGGVRIWGSIGFIVTSVVIQFSGVFNGFSIIKITLAFVSLALLLFFSTLKLPEIEKLGKNISDVEKPRNLHFGNPIGAGLFSRLPLPFWFALITAFFIKVGISGYYSFFSIFMKESYKITSVSGLWAIGAVAEIPMILWGGRLVRKFGARLMLTVSVAGASLRLFLYSSELPLPVIISAQLLHAFSFGLIHITVISVINQTVAPDRKALAMSLYGGIGLGLAGFIGSSSSGYVLENFGFRALYIYCGFITLIPLFLLIGKKRRAFFKG